MRLYLPSRLPLVLFVLVLTAVPCNTAAATHGWSTSRIETPVPGAEPVSETRWTLDRPPGEPFDRIQVHRYRTPPSESDATDARGHRPALLYLPGTNMNGGLTGHDERYSLWLYLARRGVEVFTLDYRTHFVPPDRVDDFSFMARWTTEVFVDDARLAGALARRESGNDRIFVAGFSRGVTLAYAVACVESGSGVAGLIALDGSFKHHAPQSAFDAATARQRFAAGGAFASDVAAGIGWEKRHSLMATTMADPGAAASDARFESRGQELSHILYHAWRPGALANSLHGISRPEVLARLLDGYDRYYPAVQNLEGRSIADYADDPSTPIDDAWGELEIPVLYFGATGMGSEWLLDGIYSAAKSGSKDVEIHVLERHGHLDILVGEESLSDVFAPALGFIETHGAGGGR